VSLLPPHRGDDEVLRDLDVGRPELRLERDPLRPGEDVAALDGDDLTPGDRLPGEQALAVIAAAGYCGFRPTMLAYAM
jgi:hypothetical protein